MTYEVEAVKIAITAFNNELVLDLIDVLFTDAGAESKRVTDDAFLG